MLDTEAPSSTDHNGDPLSPTQPYLSSEFTTPPPLLNVPNICETDSSDGLVLGLGFTHQDSIEKDSKSAAVEDENYSSSHDHFAAKDSTDTIETAALDTRNVDSTVVTTSATLDPAVIKPLIDEYSQQLVDAVKLHLSTLLSKR